MPRFGFVGPSYSVQSGAVADEECINLFAETNESGGAFDQAQAYGGREYSSLKSYFGTPGLAVFASIPDKPVRGSFNANGRVFVVGSTTLWEVFSDGTKANRGAIASDSNPASIAFNSLQLLIVSGGHAYCFALATNTLTEVTTLLAGTPVQCDEVDTYFIVYLAGNKFQNSQLLDGTTWPGQFVNEISKFPENITALIVNHGEPWFFSNKHYQPYQDTGSAEVFDPIEGYLQETGCVATFSVCRVDNSVFWIDQDERGACIARRSNGYNPARISTHAVEIWLQNQANLSSLVSYSYKDGGHEFWVLYVPGSDCSWVYDVGEGLWHKRQSWNSVTQQQGPHFSWNHVYAFGKHLVGDWNSGNLYQMSRTIYTDNGAPIRRLRRSPTMRDEKQFINIADVTIAFDTGEGPQPPLVNGQNGQRPPQCMFSWSKNGGKTWSPEQTLSLGNAGEYGLRVVQRRLGRARDWVFQVVITDPIFIAIVDAYYRARADA